MTCEVEYKHENPIASLDYALVNKSIIVTTREQKSPINLLRRSKAPKEQQIEHCQHLRKTSDFFSFYQLGATLAPTNSLLT